MEKVTVDLILRQLREWIENRHPISPELYLDACAKLNILKSEEMEKLYILQQQVAQAKVMLIESGDSVAKANVKVEASDIRRQMKMQEAKIEMIEEQIRISKIQARMGAEERKGY